MDANNGHVNPRWGTAIDLTACQAGKDTDARCDELHCVFRTSKKDAPPRMIPTIALLCPRDKEYVEEDYHIAAPLV